ncbi:hypothetical protein SDC9_205836 [bioreactor metagenome]|uniref:Uncharacterized protein n=1 Tax=bioreactor metagenome TaxID=1076179 RepID=A0A645J343_9ZZZZ
MGIVRITDNHHIPLQIKIAVNIGYPLEITVIGGLFLFDYFFNEGLVNSQSISDRAQKLSGAMITNGKGYCNIGNIVSFFKNLGSFNSKSIGNYKVQGSRGRVAQIIQSLSLAKKGIYPQA